jgi:hypothetical protein
LPKKLDQVFLTWLSEAKSVESSKYLHLLDPTFVSTLGESGDPSLNFR